MSKPVRAFFEAMQARDWTRAAALLAPGVEVEWPATGERFRGADFLAAQAAYPEGWTLTLLETVGHERVAARVRVEHDSRTFLCSGFYDVADGRIRSATEAWTNVAAEPRPEWRARFSETVAADELRSLRPR